MSKRLILFFVPCLMTFSVFASSVDAILALSGQERIKVASKQDLSFYRELRKVAFAENQEFDVRWKAIVLLPVVDRTRGLNDLELAAKSKRWFLRNASLVAFKEYYPERAKPWARRLLADPALVVRSAAVQVLADELTPEDRSRLWMALDDKINFRKNQGLFIRGQIAAELAKKPLANERGQFIAILEKTDESLFRAAIEGLEKIEKRSLGQIEDPIAMKRGLWLKQAARENSEAEVLR